MSNSLCFSFDNTYRLAYHILNHEVIFGGYWGQACEALDEILDMK